MDISNQTVLWGYSYFFLIHVIDRLHLHFPLASRNTIAISAVQS